MKKGHGIIKNPLPEKIGISIPEYVQKTVPGGYSKKTLGRFKRKLLDKEKEARESIKNLTPLICSGCYESSIYSSGNQHGSMENSLKINSVLIEHEWRLLKCIERSMRKIENGAYGICDCGCGEKIPIERLEATLVANQRKECKDYIDKISKNGNGMPLSKTKAR